MNLVGDCRSGLVTQRTLQQQSSNGTGTYWIPKGKLPFAHAAEASCEDVSISKENGSHGPGSLVGFLFLLKEIYRFASSNEQKSPSGGGFSSSCTELLAGHTAPPRRMTTTWSNIQLSALMLEGRNQLLNYKRNGHSWLVSALPIGLLQGWRKTSLQAMTHTQAAKFPLCIHNFGTVITQKD